MTPLKWSRRPAASAIVEAASEWVLGIVKFKRGFQGARESGPGSAAARLARRAACLAGTTGAAGAAGAAEPATARGLA